MPSRIMLTVTGRVNRKPGWNICIRNGAAGAAQQRPVGPEADVAVAVEVELASASGRAVGVAS